MKKELKLQWTCKVCTFINTNVNELCEICQSPPDEEAYESEGQEHEGEPRAEEESSQLAEEKTQNVEAGTVKEESEPGVGSECDTQAQKRKSVVDSFLQKAVVQTGICIGLTNNYMSPVIVGVGFNLREKTQQAKDEPTSLIRFRRYGYSPQYLSRFFYRTGQGVVCTVNGEFYAGSDISIVEQAIFKNEVNRFIIEALEPVFIGNQR